jgi:hypothetical protein
VSPLLDTDVNADLAFDAAEVPDPHFVRAGDCPGPASPPDLSVSIWEVTQAVQTPPGEEHLPLVTDRTTIARVAVHNDMQAAGLPCVCVRLDISGDAGYHEVSDACYIPPAVPERDDIDDSLQFSFVVDEPQEITLRAQVDPLNVWVGEAFETNNSSDDYVVDFVEAQPLDIIRIGIDLYFHMFSLMDLLDCLVGECEHYAPAGAWPGQDWLRQVLPYPVGSTQIYGLTNGAMFDWYFTGGPKLGPIERGILIVAFQSFARGLLDSGYDFDQAVGIIDDAVESGVDGMSYPEWAGGRGLVSFVVEDTDNVTLAHEVTHNIAGENGRKHAPNGLDYCGQVGQDSCGVRRAFADCDWPYSDALIHGWGLDLRFDPPRVVDETDTYDHMSYCLPRWVSPYGWLRAMGYHDEALWSSAAEESDHLIVTGRVKRAEAAGSLDEVWVLTSDESFPPLPEGADYCLELLGGGATVLASHCFGVSFENIEPAPEEPDTLDESGFSLDVPLADGTREIRLVAGSQVLDSLAVSANAPQVSIVAPAGGETISQPYTVKWQASDADGDQLRFIVRYSPDGGGQWQVIGFGLVGTEMPFDPAQVPGGDNAIIEVLASDGLNTTTATSGTFSVPAKPPTAQVVLPEDSSRIRRGDLLRLEGSATDLEDGALSGTALQWSSSIDGDLGTGETLYTNTLSSGTHIISLTARDSDGMEGQDEVTIYVGVPAPASIPIPLTQGWNMISLPLAPDDMSAAAVFAPIDDAVAVVYALDSFAGGTWLRYIPGHPELSSLQTVDPSMGLYVLATAETTLEVSGLILGLTTVSLAQGWNLVGFPAASAHPVDLWLYSLLDRVEIVYRLEADGTWRRYITAAQELSNLTEAEPGHGYLVLANSLTHFVVDYGR